MMQRIFPPSQTGYFIRGAELVHRGSTVCELGCFGAILSDSAAGASPELMNKQLGHLLRSKAEQVDEGGVAAGFAVLSSPLLI